MSTFNISVNDKEPVTIDRSELVKLDLINLSPTEYHCTRQNQSYHAIIKHLDLDKKLIIITLNERDYSCSITDALDRTLQNLNLNNTHKKVSKDLISTMPGMVLSVLVKEGQEVAKGDPLMILEAMKMENMLKASVDGQIKVIFCCANEAVDKGQLLMEIE